MAENRRKSENIRRANRVIQTRTFVLMLVLGVALGDLAWREIVNPKTKPFTA